MDKRETRVEKLDMERARKRLREEKEKGSRLISVTADKRKNDHYISYHLDEGEDGKSLIIEAELDDKKAERVTDIFENADLYERECREMYGIDFGEEMRNLFLPEGVEEPSREKLEKAMEEKEEEGK